MTYGYRLFVTILMFAIQEAVVRWQFPESKPGWRDVSRCCNMLVILFIVWVLAACAPRYEPPPLKVFVAQCPGLPDASFLAHEIRLTESATIGLVRASPLGYRYSYEVERVAVAAFPRTCRVFVLP